MDNVDDPRLEPLLAQARKDFSFEDAIRQWAIEKILAADILEDFEASLSDQRQALEAWSCRMSSAQPSSPLASTTARTARNGRR